ncbi:MAG: radical SAM protein [Planctomycetes bacterium]|nr:radical SAM protein [Planctomycetota bacterium]
MNDCGILDGLNARAYDGCIPLNVTLELTLRCNIRCTHCYNFDRDQPRAGTGPELSAEEIRTLLDDLRRAGTLFLSLSGGEAMVHPRFWEIADEAAARGFALTVLSNGTLLTEAACDRLASYANLWGVSLSVYGARPETHDAITQVAGSFERTMAGARRMAARGARIGLKFVLMKGNAAEAGTMIAGAEAEGFEFSIDPTITWRYDGTSGSLAGRVDHETLEALYRKPLRPLIKPGPAEPTDDQFKCNCARGNAAVSATGEVYPCIATPLRAGSIRERSFVDIWNESPVFQWIRGLRVADFKTCAPCGLKSWCRRSPGPAYLLTGDYTGVDPWTCREAEIIRSIATKQTV